MLEDAKTRYLILLERKPETLDEACNRAVELLELEAIINEMEV